MIAALLGNALVVAGVAPLLWIVTRRLRRPAIAHSLWVILLVKLLTPPLVVIPISTRTWALLVSRLRQADWFDSACSRVEGWGLSGTAVATVLAAIWVAGSAVVIWNMLRRAEAFRQVVAARGDVHVHASDLAARIDPGGLLFSTPPVLLVDAVHSPMLCGMGPCCWILFPRPLWHALPPAGRERLLLHELAHFRRGDCFVRVLEMVALAIFWWHPMLWLVRAQIESAEEDCCDRIAADPAPRPYAEAVLLTLDFLSDPGSLQPAPASSQLGTRTTLERRLVQIMHRSVDTSISARGRRWIVIAAIAILPCAPLPTANSEHNSSAGYSPIGSIVADMLPWHRAIRSSDP